MKYLLFVGLIFTLVSCQEEVPSWDKLNPAEQDYIRNLSANKCKKASESGMDTFLKNSREKFLSLEREDYWKIETTESGSTDKLTSYLYVWNRDNEIVYFIHKSKDGEISFIKMTADFNEKMLKDLIEKKCEDVSTDNFFVTTSSSAATIAISERPFSNHPDYFRIDTTYKTESKYPVFFARYLYDQKKKQLKESGSSTVTSTKTITAKVIASGDDYADLPTSYTGYSNPKFCIPDFIADPETEDANQVDLKFGVNSSYIINEGIEFTCTTATTGFPAPADMDMKFVPSSDL